VGVLASKDGHRDEVERIRMGSVAESRI
jgi:hypothetical protein